MRYLVDTIITATGLVMVTAVCALALGCDQAARKQGTDTEAQPGAAAGSEAAADSSQPDQGASLKVQAFLQAMVPHHTSAVQMAEIALQRAQSSELKTLAQAIISAQNAEIAQMHEIHRRLYGSELVPDDMAHQALGLSMDEAGMSMDMESLKTAEPFDIAFIDAMIPHHRGAIEMAQIALESTTDAELRQLCDSIIAAQSAEIDVLNDLRPKLSGAASPASQVAGSFDWRRMIPDQHFQPQPSGGAGWHLSS